MEMFIPLPDGPLLSGIIVMLGIGLVALPTGIISSSFMNEISSAIEDNKSEKDDILYCPYCGKQISVNPMTNDMARKEQTKKRHNN
jgi:hypothetical protein